MKSIYDLNDVFDNRRLKLILMPTEQCNFRCEYCYENFVNKRMSNEVLTGIEQLLESRANDLERLEIEWFGGEPLLAYKEILRVMRCANRFYSSNNMISNMTTNGYLLDNRRFVELTSHGVSSFQISLDGYRSAHDKTRIMANGKGSFDVIWKNLMDMKLSSIDFLVILRVHVSLENLDSTVKLIRMLKHEMEDDKRFKIFFKPIGNYDQSKDFPVRLIPDEIRDFVFGGLAHLAEGLNVSIGTSNELLRKGAICYASMPNSFVIRSNGDVSKCTVGLEDDKNIVGRISSNGRMRLDEEKMRFWIRGFEKSDNKTLMCPAWY